LAIDNIDVTATVKKVQHLLAGETAMSPTLHSTLKVLILDVSWPPGAYQTIGYESRQVFDLDIRRFVTEYRAEMMKLLLTMQQAVIAKAAHGLARRVLYSIHNTKLC
jgi:hypothetical protein